MKNNISVALATYNGSKYIKEQLFSILEQTYPPSEIIIIDDCSTDDTVVIIESIKKSYPIIQLEISKLNSGSIKTFKKAILKCNCEYIALSDQDDIWEENKLEVCIKELKSVESDNIPSLVFSDLKLIDEKGNLLGTSFWKSQGFNPVKTKLQHLLIGNIVTGCTIMMNASMKKEIAKMPNKIIMHDYWLAILGYTIGNVKAINKTPIKYRIHSNSVTLKSKISLFQRIDMFFSVFYDRQNTYLSENISQAESFFKIYQLVLTKENKDKFEEFIALKNQNSIYRKFYVFCQKYLVV